MIQLGQVIDFQTNEGVRIRAHLEARLAELRLKNEDPKLGPTETAELRGRIAELKTLIAPAVPLVPAMPSYGAQRPGRG